MRLRVLTTVFLLFGVALMVCWPFVLGHRPGPEASHRELATYALHAILYFGVTAFTFVFAALFALLAMRQARREFVEQKRENLRGLIEGSLKDHERRKP